MRVERLEAAKAERRRVEARLLAAEAPTTLRTKAVLDLAKRLSLQKKYTGLFEALRLPSERTHIEM